MKIWQLKRRANYKDYKNIDIQVKYRRHSVYETIFFGPSQISVILWQVIVLHRRLCKFVIIFFFFSRLDNTFRFLIQKTFFWWEGKFQELYNNTFTLFMNNPPALRETGYRKRKHRKTLRDIVGVYMRNLWDIVEPYDGSRAIRTQARIPSDFVLDRVSVFGERSSTERGRPEGIERVRSLDCVQSIVASKLVNSPRQANYSN